MDNNMNDINGSNHNKTRNGNHTLTGNNRVCNTNGGGGGNNRVPAARRGVKQVYANLDYKNQNDSSFQLLPESNN